MQLNSSLPVFRPLPSEFRSHLHPTATFSRILAMLKMKKKCAVPNFILIIALMNECVQFDLKIVSTLTYLQTYKPFLDRCCVYKGSSTNECIVHGEVRIS